MGIYEESSLVGAMVLNAYPNIPSIPPSDWQKCIENLYGFYGANSRNTLWIHLLVWEPRYYFFFLRPMLQTLFLEKTYLVYCILVIPPVKIKLEFLCDTGVMIAPKGKYFSRK